MARRGETKGRASNLDDRRIVKPRPALKFKQ
jgi:hypothetical protein